MVAPRAATACRPSTFLTGLTGWTGFRGICFGGAEDRRGATRDHENRRQGESPAGDWHRRFHGRLRGVASTAVKSPSPPFGFRLAAGHETRPSPHTKAPASRASRKVDSAWCLVHSAWCVSFAWEGDFVGFRVPRRRRSCPGGADRPKGERRRPCAARRSRGDAQGR